MDNYHAIDINSDDFFKILQNNWEILKPFIPPNESFYYYMNKFDEMFVDDYKPTADDIMGIRVRTTGIVEQRIPLHLLGFDSLKLNENQNNFITLVEPGGPRNERKKWLHCFQDVSGVFVLFDLSLFKINREDFSLDLIQEQIFLAAETISSKLVTADYYIIFTHIDVFLEELDICRKTLSFLQEDCPNEDLINNPRILCGLFYYFFHRNSYLDVFDCILKPNSAFILLNTICNIIIEKSFGLETKWYPTEFPRRIFFYVANLLHHDECDIMCQSIFRDQISKVYNISSFDDFGDFNNHHFLQIQSETNSCGLSYTKLFPFNFLTFWEPEIHQYLPLCIRDCIFTVFVIARASIPSPCGNFTEPKYKQCYLFKLPNEILHKIFYYLLIAWNNAK